MFRCKIYSYLSSSKVVELNCKENFKPKYFFSLFVRFFHFLVTLRKHTLHFKQMRSKILVLTFTILYYE